MLDVTVYFIFDVGLQISRYSHSYKLKDDLNIAYSQIDISLSDTAYHS